MNFVQLQQNVLSVDTWELLKPIIEKHFVFIEQLNREQLSEGQRSDNSSLPDYRQESYADFKEKYISTYEIYPTTDLRYTGSFYDKIKASFDLYGISIESFDSKAQGLEEKYGSAIYGLTDESLNKFAELIVDEFIQSLNNTILI